MAGWQRWVLGWGASGTTGTISRSQGAQSGAVVARETFSAAVAKAQASQSGSIVSQERFLVTTANAQATQTGSVVSAERFVATIAHAQSLQTAAIEAGEPASGGGAGGGGGEGGELEGSSAVIGVDYVYHLDDLVTHGDDAVWYDREGAAVQAAQTGAIVATFGDRTAELDTAQAAQSGSVAATTVAEPLPDLQAANGPRLTKPIPVTAITAIATIRTMQSAQRGQISASTNDDELVLLLAA